MDVTTASTDAFKTGFIAASASVLNVAASAISITSVTAARRKLLSGVIIVSQITSTTVTAQTVSAISSSALVNALTTSLPAYTLTVGPVVVADLSPTSAPSPSLAPVSAATTTARKNKWFDTWTHDDLQQMSQHRNFVGSATSKKKQETRFYKYDELQQQHCMFVTPEDIINSEITIYDAHNYKTRTYT